MGYFPKIALLRGIIWENDDEWIQRHPIFGPLVHPRAVTKIRRSEEADSAKGHRKSSEHHHAGLRFETQTRHGNAEGPAKCRASVDGWDG